MARRFKHEFSAEDKPTSVYTSTETYLPANKGDIRTYYDSTYGYQEYMFVQNTGSGTTAAGDSAEIEAYNTDPYGVQNGQSDDDVLGIGMFVSAITANGYGWILIYGTYAAGKNTSGAGITAGDRLAVDNGNGFKTCASGVAKGFAIAMAVSL